MKHVPFIYPEILAVFKFGGLVQCRQNKNIDGFINLVVQSGIVIRIYAYKCDTEILADFNLAVVARTTKPPNLSHRQIFRLYGIDVNATQQFWEVLNKSLPRNLFSND